MNEKQNKTKTTDYSLGGLWGLLPEATRAVCVYANNDALVCMIKDKDLLVIVSTVS